MMLIKGFALLLFLSLLTRTLLELPRLSLMSTSHSSLTAAFEGGTTVGLPRRVAAVEYEISNNHLKKYFRLYKRSSEPAEG